MNKKAERVMVDLIDLLPMQENHVFVSQGVVSSVIRTLMFYGTDVATNSWRNFFQTFAENGSSAMRRIGRIVAALDRRRSPPRTIHY